MPAENLEEEGLPKNPNLELAAWRFTITNPDGKDKEEAKRKLLEAIKENGTHCIYASSCANTASKFIDFIIVFFLVTKLFFVLILLNIIQFQI